MPIFKQPQVNQTEVNEFCQEVLINFRIAEQLGDSGESKYHDTLKFIKQLYCSIDTKKAVRDKLVADGFISRKKDKTKYKEKLNKVSSNQITKKFSLFSGVIRRISMNFGVGIRSYFVFLKFLFFLNLFAAVLTIIFLFVPHTILYWNYDPFLSPPTGTETVAFNLSRTCSALYVINISYTASHLIVDFIQGTGWIERSGMFYGNYKGINSDLSALLGINFSYDMSIAYFLTLSAYFLISLVCISRSVNYSFKTITVEQANKIGENVFSGFVFAGNDSTQTNKAIQENTIKNLKNDILNNLNAHHDLIRRQSRSICQKVILFFKRFFINLFAMGLLGGSGYAIYYVYTYSLEVSTTGNYYFNDERFKLFIQYAPSLTLVMLNIIVPIIVEMLVVWEDYEPKIELRLVLIRTILIKLASFCILIYTLYAQITCQPKNSCYVSTGSCSSIICWETYVGQQLYKLVIMDFIVASFMTAVVEPLKKCCCGRLMGPPQFSILKNVLDLIYNQTIAWIGACFSPLFSAICAIKYLITFYLKLLSINYVTVPQNKSYISSNITGLFLGFLLFMYLILTIPITYIMFSQTTSKGCGPFREYSTMFESLSIRLHSLNSHFYDFLGFIVSTSVILFILIILLLVVIYYINVANSLKIIIRKLRETLIKETQSKRILLMTKS